MMEYISPKSKLKFSSYLFPSVSPSDCVGITGSSFPVRAVQAQALHSSGVGIWDMVSITERLNLRYVCSAAWDRKKNEIN